LVANVEASTKTFLTLEKSSRRSEFSLAANINEILATSVPPRHPRHEASYDPHPSITKLISMDEKNKAIHDQEPPRRAVQAGVNTQWFNRNPPTKMSELSFAKQFLATLDTRPVQIPSDHVEDTRKQPAQSGVRICRFHSKVFVHDTDICDFLVHLTKNANRNEET
jgi:Blt1 N-terminal domain